MILMICFCCYRYASLIKQRDNPLRTSQDIKYLREQADHANRKAEEAREKNALLRAHLMDLERQKDDFALEEVGESYFILEIVIRRYRIVF